MRNYKVDTTLVFFNPKAGLTYRPKNGQRIYASVAVGSKEPNRNDFVDAIDPSKVKPERMTDFEGGYELRKKNGYVAANVYYMLYKDQLVLTGALNDVGAPLRTNAAQSFRRGIELEGSASFLRYWSLQGNLTLSQNKIQQFAEILYDYTLGFDVVEIDYTNTDISFSPAVIAAARLNYHLPLFEGVFGWRYKKSAEGYITSRDLYFTLQNKYVSKQYLDNTQSELRSMPSYFVNDVLIRYERAKAGGLNFTMQLTINNALDVKYVTNGYTFGYINETRISERFYYPQAGRNYMLSIGVRI